MKTIICFTILLLTFNSITFCQSVIHYQTGTGIEVGAGANICADTVIINGTFSGGGTICGSSLFVLTLTTFIEGFYNSASNKMVSDTVRVYLRNATNPYAIVDSSLSVVDSSGAASFNFSNVSNGVNYYIVLKHRNSIETWSSLPNSFSTNALTYNFSISHTMAFGNNLISVDAIPQRYGIFSGDATQDGFVNLTDIINVSNDGTNFITGYVPSDMNGDNSVNLTDLLITYNNSSGFVSIMRP